MSHFVAARRFLFSLFLIIAVVFVSLRPDVALANATVNVMLSTSFPVVNSGDWSVIYVDYSCSSVVSTPCENATVTTVIPLELAGGSGDVQALGAGTSASYNPTTRTVTWTFSSPLAPGDSGRLELRVRFPAGITPDGTTATLRAEMRSTTAPPRLSNPLTITARAEPRAVATKTFVSGGAPDVPTTYQLQVCIPDNGSGALNLTNVQITDALPVGATFVSASDGGSFNSSTNTVSWPATSLTVPGNLCATRTVTVIFPSASFPVGTEVRNVMNVSAQAGSATITLTDDDVRRIQPPTPGYGFTKNGPTSALVGGTVTYTFNTINTGTTPLNDVVVTDPVPPELEVTRITVAGGNIAGVRVELAYTTNVNSTFTPVGTFTTTSCVNIAPVSGGGCSTLTLGAGERITAIRWRYLDPLPFGFSATGHNFSAVVTAVPVNAVVVNQATSTFTYNGYTATRLDEARTRIIEPGSRAVVMKSVNPAVAYAGDTVTYTITLENNQLGSVSAGLVDPVLADLLVESLRYVAGSSVVVSKPTGAPDPVLDVIDNYNGTGRTLLRWRWSGYNLPPNASFTIRFQAQIDPATVTGTIANTASLASFANPPGQIFIDQCSQQAPDSHDFDSDGNISELICSSSITSLSLAAAATASSAKWVLGQLDTEWTRDPYTGMTTPGGMADYRLIITNTNSVPLTNLVLIDILPWVGDVGVVRFNQPRESQWQPYLAGPIAVPDGATVYYSTTNNPCRNPDLGLTDTSGNPIDAPGCVDPQWSTTLPTDITTVRSVRIDFGSRILYPQDSVVITWPMRAPLGGTPGEIAWNTFGYRAFDIYGNPLLAAEPPRVGIERGAVIPPSYGNYVWLDADLDGVQDPGETGVNGARIDFYQDSDGVAGPSAGDRWVGFTISGPDNDGNPGYYLFSDPYDIPPGDYYIRVTPPAGYGFTTPDQGGDDTRDSDVDPISRYSAVTTLESGENDDRWDVGLVTVTAVGDYVWIDRNGNGVQDEPPSDGVNGITVRLYNGSGTLIATTVTADDLLGKPGYYLFSGLSAGSYFIEFVLPTGFTFTTADSGSNDNQDSDANPTTGRTGVFTLAANQLDRSRDAGLIVPTGNLRLGNRVWYDRDNDGRYEPTNGESGINGVRLSLFRDVNNNGLPDAGEYVGGATTSTVGGEAGYYQFTNLAAGNYIVVVDDDNFAPGGVLYGMRSSSGNDPAPDPDNDVDHDDNGTLIAGIVRSLPITLSVGGEPTTDGDDANGNQTLDFGFIRGAALGDRVWFDTNGNGIQDTGEPGVAGITVELLDGSGNPIDSDLGTAGVQPTITVTDGAGRYGFTGLNAGTYRVRFSNLPAGYSFTTADQGTNNELDSDVDASGLTPVITLTANQTDLSWDAGLVALLASVGDRVWNDLNYNGIQDASEPGVNGVQVSLFRPGYDGVAGTADDELVATTTTGTDGLYSFTNLPPGRYFVQFGAPPTGYTLTATDQGSDDAADSDADVTTRRTALIDLAPGANDPDWDMGLFVFASIGDRVWRDTNNNGFQDTGEIGVGGVQVRLYRPGSSVPVATTTTNSSGIYTFTNLVPGDYYVEFSLPVGHRASPQNQGSDDTHDSDADPITRQTAATTLDPGENDPSWDFGIVPTASIGDRVWRDDNADGIQDASETAGIPGVQVVLYDSAGNPLNTTVTDADGFYRFENLLAGDYYLRFVVPASYIVSPRDQGSNDNADSDVDPNTFLTTTTTLSAGENDLRWDLGLYQLASLGDRVWHDVNGNGRQDSGELGVANVPVSLYQPGTDGIAGTADDVLVASTTTNGSGEYLFTNLQPGRYFVQFGTAPGYSLLSPRDAVVATDETDSDVDANRRTPIVELLSGTSNRSLDMGVLNPASLGNRVWFDSDVDGIQDSGESGVNGVTVSLYRLDGTLVATQTTDSNGEYLFTNLAPGEYYVVFSNLPANHSFTRLDQGSDDTADSDANPIDGRTGIVRLNSGDNNLTVDAGIFETITVGDRVWLDLDADGIQDADETTGIPGVRVELLRDSDGVVLDYTYTDGNGLYQFTNLFPGTYRIRFSEIPTGYVRSPQDRGGNDQFDSDANATFETAPFTPVSGNNPQYDLGLYRPARIGNFVWEDRNGNGRQDAGEPGIPNVTVTLNGTTGAGDPVSLTAQTDSNGFYLFNNLTPGSYSITVSAPAGYFFTAADQGDDSGDSDASSTGVMATTTLESGEEDLTWDAGLYRPATIGDRVWRDTNGNGVQDTGETGLDGVTVTLTGTTGSGALVNQTTTTAGGGFYSFTGLVPGTYQITVTAPTGEVFTYRDITATEVAGANDANDSDADASGVMIATVLESGEVDLTWDAGLVIPASLGDFVWEDLDGDGVQETGEPGFVNVSVALIGAGRDRTFGTADDTLATTTTNGSGAYSFTNLQPGLYRVRFTRPNGYAFTIGDAAAATDATDSDVPTGVSATATTITIDLESGENDLTWDAGLYQLLSLGNRVWEDTNNDGQLSAGEVGIDGVTVRLYRDLNGDGDVNDSGETTPVATTTTNHGGYYLFSGLVQGDYLVEVVLPGGYVSSTGANGSASGPYEPAPDADTNATDSDDNGSQSGGVVRSTIVRLRPNSEPTGESDPLPAALTDPARNENSNLTVDFGLFRPARIGNLVWFDRDANGVQNGGDETGIGGVTVQLFFDTDGDGQPSAGDTLVATATTAADGSYGFNYLIPGSYYLNFALPTGYVRSPQDQGGNDETDSDPDRTNGRTGMIMLFAGQNDQSRDAGLYQLVNLGNRVWNDVNNNGLLDAGESGIDGVTVNLYYDANRNGTIDGSETTPLATTTTSGGGFYSFINLDPGDYLVEIPASNFTAGNALGPSGTQPAFRSSTGIVGSATGPYEAAPDPDNNVDNDDNGTTDGSGNIRSAIITLRSQDEPTTDGDGNNGNLTLDFGFFRPLALGNLVWHDYNNNRTVDPGEPGINGVVVQLYRDVNGNGSYDAGTDALVAMTTTSGGGNYRFDNLIPGDYLVVIPANNFASGGALRFFRSSDGGNANDGATTADPDTDVDGDDNGIGPNVGIVTGATTDLVRSAAVTLSIGGEPTGEDGDSNTNLTVDFGFYSLTIGNRVWLDHNNNGVFDAGDGSGGYANGRTVRLFYDANGNGVLDGTETTPIATFTTSNGGRYLFGGLRDGGNYVVEVVSDDIYVSSTGINGMATGPYEPAPDPDSSTVDNDDNGTANGNNERSAVFTVRVGLMPTGEPDTAMPTGVTNPAIDANSNLTIDFGLFDEGQIGDQVWLDVNGNGIRDTGETTYIAGVTVTIYSAATNQPLDGDPNTPGVQPITRTSVASATSYLFNRLIAGTYYLVFSDIPAQYAISPLDQGGDDTRDSDVNPATLQTTTITLGNTNNNDLRWDLGLYPRLTLGNLVWYDANDNGVVDSGESGIPNVRVELYRDSNGNGQAEAAEFVTFTTTDTDGTYRFSGLEQGDYIVVIPASNFAAGQPLYRHRSSTGSNGSATGTYEPAPDPDNNIDNDDNGTDTINGVVSGVISLNPSFEPTTDGDDANGNLTLDFGFFEPLTLGNLVWNDLNNNGVVDAGEPGIDGVRVELYLDSNGNNQADAGELVTSTTTSGGGRYSFTDLIEGDYIVRIPASQFATGQPLAGFVSSTGTNGSATGPYEAAPDPDNNVDNDDNGTTGGSGNVDSAPIMLARGTEPDIAVDGDGTNGNLTVDFGFFRQARLGDRVWHDQNANGVQDSGETGISGVTVELFSTGPDNAIGGGDDTLVASTTTAVNGIYGFTHLIPGSYYLRFALPDGYSDVSPRDQGSNDTVDSDADPTTRLTSVITLPVGANDQTWDMGVFNRASVGNFVWEDVNGNGQQDGGENGIGSVTVTLYRSDGTVVGSTATAGDGSYSFSGLLPGSYYLEFSNLPAGYVFTFADTGSDASDSDANRTTGRTATFTLVSGQTDNTWDAGLYRPASLGDQVWLDTNGNGVQDVGETTGVADVAVAIFSVGPNGVIGGGDDVFIDATSTDSNGNYSFSGLAPGNYYLLFNLPPGFNISPPDQGSNDTTDSDVHPISRQTIVITLRSGDNDPTWDMGLYRLASIGNYVWEDTNGNGVQDAGEPGVEGVEVRLTGTTGAGVAVSRTTTTDSNGFYRFDDLVPGTYTVTVVPPTGYVLTAANQGSDDAIDSDANPTTGAMSATVLESGEVDLTWDAGLYRPASIGNYVWEDTNGNGVQDASEPGVEGVEVRLTGTTGAGAAVSRTTTTDSNGFYRFDNLAPGTYTVTVVPPTGYVLTAANQGSDDALDSDANPTTGAMSATVLESGEVDLTWDAGLYRPASIGDRVWRDTNGNGVQDAGEPGVEGVEVRLTGTTGAGVAVSRTTTTDSNGFYRFDNLAPGTYTITVIAPTGDGFTVADQGGDDAQDSDANAGGVMPSTTLVSGEEDLSWDAGVFGAASIGNYVWEDTNGNGVQDVGEPGVEGVEIRLTGTTGAGVAVSRTTTTDSNGFYRFDNLAPGTYTVTVVPPTDYVLTAANQGSDDALDSDANPTTGAMSATVLESGEVDLTWDAGLYRLASIGNYVWEDTNGNGVQDAGEPGVEGVEVRLTGTTGAGVAVSRTTTTDSNGFYRFDNLAPGTYTVTVVPPTGYVLTAANQGSDDAIDSDANPTTGAMSATVLESGEVDLTWDAGLYRPVSIGNYVWEDLNGNGLQDAGEPGVRGVTVQLSGTTGAGVTVSRSAITDDNGFYRFDDLAPGTYTVTVVAPAGFLITAANQGSNDAIDSDADPTTGAMSATVLESGEVDLTWDAGLYRPASIGDRVWRDTNGNGVQDAGEPGVANVEVRLSGTTGAGVAVSRTTTTNGSGLYRFDNLAPGIYTITVIAPAGDGFTVADQGGDDAQDSDADSGGVMPSTTLVSGEEDLSWDAGLFGAASIGNYVWEDTNGNGVQDVGEPGVEGVEVRLSGTTGAGVAVSRTTTTDSNGFYRFDDLAPGTYTVTVVPPTGYVLTAANQGSDDAIDSDAHPTTGAMSATVLESGEVDLTWDAGLYRPASIGNYVWEDLNGNGVQDVGEPGLEGVEVRLSGTTGAGVAVSRTTTTDSNGFYRFDDLAPGTYTVTVVPPTGYVITAANQGSNDAIDSDADPTTGAMSATVLESGEVDLTWDAGLYRPASIGDRVWFDTDGDGVQGATETGIRDIVVTLTGAGPDGVFGTADDISRNATTDSNGEYLFTDLPPGEYRLRFTNIPSGLTFSPADSSGDDTTDSDVVTATGDTASFTLLSNQADLSRDAGLYPLLSLGNLVWEDVNNNGVVDSGENGASGIEVRLYRDGNGNGVWDEADTLVDTTFTDGDGFYRFTNLPQGNYFVVLPGSQFAADSPWYGYRSSTGARSLTSGPYEPGVLANSDLDNDDNGTRQSNAAIISSLITLRPDTEPDTTVDGDGRNSNLTVDFGIFRPATVGDRVWNDLNGNGIQDSGEPGIEGVLVTLYDVGDDGNAGTTDDTIVATRRTDGDGFYMFENVPPGSYYLVFSDLPTSGRFTRPGEGGNEATDSDVDPGSSSTAVFTLRSGTDDDRWDAGLILPASIGNLVWEDRDGDGIQDDGEPGIAGVTLRLIGTDIDGNSIDISAITNENGFYRFERLAPGTYTVTVIPPTGYFITAANQGSNDALDSDADPITGAMTATVLESGEVDLTWDAGLYRPASIGNYVWEDLNGNGVQEAGEPGVRGVTVQLSGTTGAGVTVSRSAITDDNGFYRFDDLAPGTYTVTVVPPTGYVLTAANRGSNDAIDSDANPTTGAMSATVLESGEVDLTWDAGLYRPASVGNRVWHDLNANGIADAGEQGVGGVTVSLYRSDGTLVDTVVTDSNGYYLFTNLPPGQYYLTFTIPNGWVFSAPGQGGDDNRDSDVNPATGQTTVFTLGYGQTDTSWWAGIHQPAPPTAITLLSFTAERQGNGVLLRWVTGSERDTVGFLLLRSSTGYRADATPIVTMPIPAQGSAGSGASYQWFDRTAQPNVSYHYWLVEIEADGEQHEFSLISPAVQFTYRVLVPIIQR